MQAEFGTQINIGEGSIGGNLDKMIAQCMEWCGKIGVISLEFVKLRDIYQKVVLYVFILRGPNSFTTFIDDCVLVWVVVGSGAWQGSEEIGDWGRGQLPGGWGDGGHDKGE